MTVVIAAHNGEDYIAETIDSVLAQTCPATEILVVDDGSTDGTAAIIRSYGDRVKLLSIKKSGVSVARNFGIQASKNEWVALVDHDDLWTPDHLELLGQTIVANPTADICYSGVRNLVFDERANAFALADVRKFHPADEMPETLMDYCAFTPSASAVRRETVLAVGGFDPHFVNGQDWDLWLRMMHAGARFAHSSKPTMIYRIHPRSHSHKVRRAVGFCTEIVRKEIVPHKGAVHGLRVISRLESDGALRLRENGLPGALSLMLKSLFHYPLNKPSRYKMATHMVLRGYPKSDLSRLPVQKRLLV